MMRMSHVMARPERIRNRIFGLMLRMLGLFVVVVEEEEESLFVACTSNCLVFVVVGVGSSYGPGLVWCCIWCSSSRNGMYVSCSVPLLESAPPSVPG